MKRQAALIAREQQIHRKLPSPHQVPKWGIGSTPPLNMGATRTPWPVPNRPISPSRQPEQRANGNALFRRFPNGMLDYDTATAVVQEAIRKSRVGIPPNENDAIALSCMYGLQFKDLPTQVVNIRAPLTEQEKEIVRQRVQQMGTY